MAEKLIDIRKIVRNTTKTNLTNGDMEEIINLRHEDGKWKPLPDNVKIWQTINSRLNVTDEDGTKSSQYTQIFIHTGKSYKHVLAVRESDHAIVYVGDANSDDTLTLHNDIATGVSVCSDKINVHQVGNLLVLNDEEQVQYILFKDGAYVRKTINPNELNAEGFLEPDGLSQLRVVPTCNEHGVPVMLVANGDITDNENPSWDSVKEEASATGLSMIAQARKIAKERGLLNGFVVGVVAYQLYDGSYTFASRPILLSQPNDEGTRYEEQYGFEDVAKVIPDVDMRDSITPYVNRTAVDVNGEASSEYSMHPIESNGKKHSYKYKPKAMNVAWQKNERFTADEYKANNRGYFWNNFIKDAAEKFGTESDSKLMDTFKNNCEIYWGGGEQGHNAGQVYKDGVVDVGGNDSGVSQYGEMPLYEKDESKSSDDADVPMAFDMFSMTVKGKSGGYKDAWRELDTTVSIRGSFAQEITIPSEDRLKAGNRQFEFQRGCDTFNPPNAFSVVHCDTAGDDLCHNWFSNARKIKDMQQAYGFLMTNGLQVKLGKFNSDYSDIISNVCVFISSEIYYADETDGTSVKVPITDICWTGSGSGSRKVKETGATVYANPKEDKKLAQDIKDVAAFYQVWSKPYKGIATDEWIDIDLKDKLNILEEQETLNVDASNCRNSLKAKCSYLYNGRLHLGNIEESYFDGYPLSYFEMPEQWNKSVATNYSRSVACAYDIRSTGGKNTNYPAFNRIGTELADIYVAHKATVGTSEDKTFLNVNSSIYTYGKDGSTYGYVRYVDSDTGGFYTKTYDGNRVDISNNTYDLLNGDTWTTENYLTMDIDNEMFVFLKVDNVSSIPFKYEEDWVLTGSERYYTHRKDANVGFWEGLAGSGNVLNKITQVLADMVIIVTGNGLSGGVPMSIVAKVWKENDTVGSIRKSLMDSITSFTDIDGQQCAADRYFGSRLFNTMWWKYDVCKQWDYKSSSLDEDGVDVFTVVELDTSEGKRIVGRIENRKTVKPLNPMLSYPDSRAKKMTIGWIDKENGKVYQKTFTMDKFNALSCAVYVSEDVKPIEWWNSLEEKELNGHEYVEVVDGVSSIKRVATIEDRRNVLKVSATESPLYFPAENTYQIGNGEIRALMSNTVALSTGQCGDAPLYVFCSDGIYGLFVDSTGQMCYPNSRPISREVCNNSFGVLPIDDAVVYPSSRGMFLISGSNNVEVSKQAEGNPLKFADNSTKDYLNSMKLVTNRTLNNRWLTIPYAPTEEDFKDYIKNAVCGWNYLHSELWVSNPDKAYTYIYSENGWSKVMRKIEYYINDYPRTYAIEVDKNGDRHVIDIENSEDTQTDCFFITRPIVLDGESAKTFTRAWMYGDFSVYNDAIATEGKHKASILVYGSHDGAKFGLVGVGGVTGNSRNILAKLHRMSMRYIRIAFAGRLYPKSVLECLGLEVKGSWGEDSTSKVR